jgi:flagellar assembly protein FliH
VIKSAFAVAKSPYLVVNNETNCSVVCEEKDVPEKREDDSEFLRQLELLKIEAQKGAAELIAQARRDAEQIAEQIIQSARNKAEAEKDKVFQEAYNQGYDEGLKQGKLEMQKIIDEANEILELAYKKKEEILKTLEPEIVEIIISAAKKIVLLESTNPQQIMYTIRNAFKKINQQEHVTIKVNPDDLETVRKARQDLIDWDVVPYIDIEIDHLIEQGGCIIETEYGSVDARISSQLDEMNRIIKGAAKDE